jgi:hypothetical protein
MAIELISKAKIHIHGFMMDKVIVIAIDVRKGARDSLRGAHGSKQIIL